jgi:hypothetical protein
MGIRRLTNGELSNFEERAKKRKWYLEQARGARTLSDFERNDLIQSVQSLMLIEEVKLYRTY